METKKNLIHSQNFMVYTDEPQPELLGVTHNLSKEGMLLVSLERITPHSEVEMFIATPEGLFPVTCEVEWATIYTHDSSAHTLYALEMKIVKAPASFYNFIACLKYNMSQQQVSPSMH